MNDDNSCEFMVTFLSYNLHFLTLSTLKKNRVFHQIHKTELSFFEIEPFNQVRSNISKTSTNQSRMYVITKFNCYRVFPVINNSA